MSGTNNNLNSSELRISTLLLSQNVTFFQKCTLHTQNEVVPLKLFMSRASSFNGFLDCLLLQGKKHSFVQ